MTTEEGWINPLLLGGSEPATLEIRLYLAIGRSWGATSEEWETWDPDPERKGEAGEGYRCRCLAHVRPEWGGQWLVILTSRTGWMLVPIPITSSSPIARVEVPPLPPAPGR